MIFIAIAVAAALFLVFGPRSTEPAMRRDLTPETRRMLLQTLYRQGFDRGMMFVFVEGEKRFVQFVKLVRPRGRTGIRSDFPYTEWSEGYYEHVRTILDSIGASYVDESKPSGPAMQGGLPSRNLAIEFGSDLDLASEYLTRVFRDVFRVDVSQRGVAWIENFSNLPRRIGLD